ncbi:WD40 repeat-like protein [Suillus decipiens]|nr:WD40 repeat-like protein [Suillus decipiens]
MASATTKAARTELILKPVTTLKGHGERIQSISYFPDGQRMISGSLDKTTRQWDLKEGKEIEGARDIRKKEVHAVAVSVDGRWVVTSSGDWDSGELKACEVETGIVKIFEGHSQYIYCIDISADSILLASGSYDETARIWNLETGKLVAGPFKSIGRVGAVRFSQDSKKLAVKLGMGTCLEVWDIQSQKLDMRIGKHEPRGVAFSPVFWTNKNKTIIAAFEFSSTADLKLDDLAKTIYEFDASTLETVGAPFEGHTKSIWDLVLSSDDALLASCTAYDNTIKLWAYESRQLFASFNVQNPDCLICICDTPPDILAQIVARKKSAHSDDLLSFGATCRPLAGHRRPPIFATSIAPRPPPVRVPQQPTFLRLGKFLRFPSRMNAVRSLRNHQPRDPLDFSATSPLPPNRLPAESTPSNSLPGGMGFFNPTKSLPDKGKQKAREPKRKHVKVADVPLGQATYGDVVGVDDGVRPFVLFFCLSWFQKREKKPEPRPVYDDELDDDEE